MANTFTLTGRGPGDRSLTLRSGIYFRTGVNRFYKFLSANKEGFLKCAVYDVDKKGEAVMQKQNHKHCYEGRSWQHSFLAGDLEVSATPFTPMQARAQPKPAKKATKAPQPKEPRKPITAPKKPQAVQGSLLSMFE